MKSSLATSQLFLPILLLENNEQEKFSWHFYCITLYLNVLVTKRQKLLFIAQSTENIKTNHFTWSSIHNTVNIFIFKWNFVFAIFQESFVKLNHHEIDHLSAANAKIKRCENRFTVISLLHWSSTVTIWAAAWENLFMPYANNKGADQPAHPRSLISAYVVRCLDSVIPLLAIDEI